MTKTAAMIVTQTEDGKFTVLDAAGKVHEVSSEEELGALCCSIVNDPDLPQYETQMAQANGLSDIAAKFAEAVLPENFGFMAEPAAGLLKKAVGSLRNVNTPKRHPTKIHSTARSREEAAKRTKERIAEKERKKAEARLAAERRRKERPRLPSLRLSKKTA